MDGQQVVFVWRLPMPFQQRVALITWWRLLVSFQIGSFGSKVSKAGWAYRMGRARAWASLTGWNVSILGESLAWKGKWKVVLSGSEWLRVRSAAKVCSSPICPSTWSERTLPSKSGVRSVGKYSKTSTVLAFTKHAITPELLPTSTTTQRSIPHTTTRPFLPSPLPKDRPFINPPCAQPFTFHRPPNPPHPSLHLIASGGWMEAGTLPTHRTSSRPLVTALRPRLNHIRLLL